MSCNLIGIDSCGFNKASIKKIHVFPFSDISEYIYDNDNLNKITGYSALSLPVSYVPNKNMSNYSGSKNSTNYDSFTHKLQIGFPKMDELKRAEFEKMEQKDLTIIFEDANEKSWIMGKDSPARIVNIEATGGVKGGDNSYLITILSTEKDQLQEISTVSENCFASFSGLESRRSVIIVENSDLLDWEYIVISADERVINYTPIPALQPTLWNSNPTVYADDLAQLVGLFAAGGTISNFSATYNGTTKEVTITIDSPDTSFGAIIVDGILQNPSTIEIVLNLTAVLSPAIAVSSTIIQVSDSLGVLYSFGYGQTITGVPGVTGTAGNAIISVSSLYSTTTTFTATLVDLPCSSVQYKYVFENTLIPCELTTDFDFFKGETIKIFLPYVQYSNILTTGEQCPRFQNIHINILGTVFVMYQEHTEWHDDLAQFESDLTTLIGQTTTQIDVASMVFTDETTGVSIRFKTTTAYPESFLVYAKPYIRGLSEPTPTNTGFLQSRVLNILTSAPVGSIVTIENDVAKQIVGQNLVNITSNSGIVLENCQTTSNSSIENIGVLFALDGTQPYNEVSEITTNSTSSTCLTPEVVSKFTKCFDGILSSNDNYYITLSLDVSDGNYNADSFEIIVDSSSHTINLPSALTPNSNFHLLSSKLNEIKGIRVLHFGFRTMISTYEIHLKVSNLSSVISLQELNNNRFFTISSPADIFTNTLTQKINPYATLNWDLPTDVPSDVTGDKDLTIGEWQEDLNLENSDFDLVFDWVVLDDELTVTRVNSLQNVSVKVYLWEDYPIDGVSSVLGNTLSIGSTSYVFENVLTALGALANGGFIVVTNTFGQAYVYEADFTSDFSFVHQEKYRMPKIWGTMDVLEYIGTVSTVAPTYTTTDPDC